MNGRFLREKKTNPFHETLVALKMTLLIKAHAQKLKSSLHSDMEYPTKCVLIQRTPDKMLHDVFLKTIIPLCDCFLPSLWSHYLIHS